MEPDPEHIRWAARRRMALWSFRFMVVMTVGLIVFGLFWPGGISVLLQLIPVIFPLYAIVAGYMGIDAVNRRNAD